MIILDLLILVLGFFIEKIFYIKVIWIKNENENNENIKKTKTSNSDKKKNKRIYGKRRGISGLLLILQLFVYLPIVSMSLLLLYLYLICPFYILFFISVLSTFFTSTMPIIN